MLQPVGAGLDAHPGLELHVFRGMSSLTRTAHAALSIPAPEDEKGAAWVSWNPPKSVVHWQGISGALDYLNGLQPSDMSV